MRGIRNDSAKALSGSGRARSTDATTRGYVAKAVVTAGLLLLVILAAYAAFNDRGAELHVVVNYVMTLVSFVLGYYFSRSRGE